VFSEGARESKNKGRDVGGKVGGKIEDFGI
jgi:hypothetical protein